MAPFDWLLDTINSLARVASFSFARSSFRHFLPFVLVAVMSDSESNVQGTKDKETPENPKPQSSELVDEVVTLSKEYLNTKHKAKGKLIEDQSKIGRSASEFKFEGNRKKTWLL